MFQNSSSYKKQDKICSISNFSSSQNSQNLNEQQIIAHARNFANQLQRHEQKRFHKPLFIITPDLTSKHINALTQILQKNRVPIQYQHQTQSLGLQLDTRFFVVVDNKNGPLKLGKQFNSPFMTIIGYPKIGNNKQNIYCQHAEDVFYQYKYFVNANSKPLLANEQYQLQNSEIIDKQQKSMMKSGSSGFSILRSKISGLKLKSISKYDRKKKQANHKKQSSNKENLTSIRDIFVQNETIHNLYFLQSLQNQPFNNMIGRYYHQIKLSTSKNIEESTFYFRAEGDLVRKLNLFNPFNSKKSIKQIQQQQDDYMRLPKNIPKKLHYVLVSSEFALRLATRINCEFYAFKDKIRLIVVLLTQHEPAIDDEQVLEKQMFLVKKTIHSNIFQSLVCSQQECQKMLKSIGFRFNCEIPQIKVGPNDCKSILTKSNKKMNGTQKKLKTQKESPISQDMISFCPRAKNTVQINEEGNMNHSIRSGQITTMNEKIQLQRQNNLMSRTQQFAQQHSGLSQQFAKPQSALSPSLNKSRIIIRPINSILSPQKSTVSSNGSKIKIIKVLKKKPQNQSAQREQYNAQKDNKSIPKAYLSGSKANLNDSKAQQRGKSISLVNSQYCLKKNKSIVQKMQSKMALPNSRVKLKSCELDSLESIENHLQSQQRIQTDNHNNSQSKVSIHSTQKSFSNPSKLLSIRDSNQISAKRLAKNDQIIASTNSKKFKKIKLNLHTEEPFIAQCSQFSLPDDQKSQSSYKNIRKLKKQVKKDSFNPLSASEYYFSSSNEGKKKVKSAANHGNFINGLVHVEYNEFITLIVDQFKKNCPSSIIEKDSYKPFYLSCEYSKQIKKIWKNSNRRCILPSLVDIQGLRQICNYYSNVTYEDGQHHYGSTFQGNMTGMSQKFTNHLTVEPNSSSDNSHMLLFFTIVSQKQVDNQVFERLDWIAQKLPKHEIIKCVVEQDILDKQMKEKANQIYTQMIAYFAELKQEYGDRFLQTV